MASFQHKHPTEAAAREQAVSDYPDVSVLIIQSTFNGQVAFYLEDGAEGQMVRVWEHEVYSGLGRDACAVQPGDVVQVTDRRSRFGGCVLTLLAIEGGWFLCRNDTCGTLYHHGVRAVRVRSVRRLRRP